MQNKCRCGWQVTQLIEQLINLPVVELDDTPTEQSHDLSSEASFSQKADIGGLEVTCKNHSLFAAKMMYNVPIPSKRHL